MSGKPDDIPEDVWETARDRVVTLDTVATNF
jgi:hypothetical protein